MADKLVDKSPAERYAEAERETEIGSTSGESHDAVLARTLGRERGLMAATGVHGQDPVIEGDEFEVAGQHEGVVERGAGESAPEGVNAEINDKKMSRHGDLGGEA